MRAPAAGVAAILLLLVAIGSAVADLRVRPYLDGDGVPERDENHNVAALPVDIGDLPHLLVTAAGGQRPGRRARLA